METKPKRVRRAALKGLDSEINSQRSQHSKGGLAQRKAVKSSEKAVLPVLVAGREVVGRGLQVFKSSVKDSVWVPGAVKDFDEPNILHKIQYDQTSKEFKETGEEIPEEWLRLSDNRFMWRDDGFVCTHANPTFSLRFTPRKEHAVGQRVKVFWTMMGKWYQGKVVDYDASSGKHRVRFKDGDAKPYHIHQEALVWLDIPQLSSATAIKKTKVEEGDLTPIAVITNDENQAPVVDVRVEQGSTNTIAQKNSRDTPAKRRQQKKSEQSQDTKPSKVVEGRKSARTPVSTAPNIENGVKPSKPTKSESKPSNGKNKLANGKRVSVGKDAKPTAITPLQESTKASAEEVKSASSSSEAAKSSGQNVAVLVQANGVATANGHAQMNGKTPMGVQNGRTIIQGNGVVTYSNANGNAQTVSANGKTPLPGQKRGRVGSVTLAASPIPDPHAPDPKRRTVNKLSRGPGKAVRKQKLTEESRLGSSRRQKTEADLLFEESCRAVEHARVGVWWEEDKCFYKGKVTGFDGVRKKLKIHYDDGVDEHIYPYKEDCKFKWLVPRARTAGATDRVHSAFEVLRAINAKNAPPMKASIKTEVTTAKVEEKGQNPGQETKCVPSPSPTQPNPSNQLPHTRDGSHLDALVPRANGTMQVPRLEIPIKAETSPSHPANLNSSNTLALHCGPSPHSSTSRMLTPASMATSISSGLSAIISGKTSIPLLLPHLSNGKKPLNGTMLGYPHQNLTPSMLKPAVNGLTTLPPSMSSKAQEQKKKSHPQGSAAEGWKISLLFRGDNTVCSGRIIMYDEKHGDLKHHVLWEDGEDEWIDIEKEQLTWIEPRSKNSGLAAGLPPGESEKLGYELVGWHIAVYWKEEKQFFEGVVEGYDEELDQYTIGYADGDQRCEPLDGVIFKYVLPAGVQTAEGGRRSLRQRRVSEYERDETPPAERRRRKASRAGNDDDSEDDWGSSYNLDRKSMPRQISVTPRVGLWSQGSLLGQQSLDTPRNGRPNVTISRCLSGRGSLLCFKGEDIPNSPAGSPGFNSPQSSLGFSSLKAEAKSPALVRPLSNVRNAQGFLTNVKRLRIFLDRPNSSGAKSQPQTLPDKKDSLIKREDSAEAGKEKLPNPQGTVISPIAENEDIPEKLKMMLNRVVLAKQRVEDGMPLHTQDNIPSNLKSELSTVTMAKSLEPDTKPEVKIEQEDAPKSLDEEKEAIQTVLSVSQPQIAEHLTPPPSPFSGFRERSAQLEEEPKEFDAQSGQQITSTENRTSHLDQYSMSLPHTPTVMCESNLAVPSRNGSIISGPSLEDEKSVAAQIVDKAKLFHKERISPEKVAARG